MNDAGVAPVRGVNRFRAYPGLTSWAKFVPPLRGCGGLDAVSDGTKLKVKSPTLTLKEPTLEWGTLCASRAVELIGVLRLRI